MNVSAVEKARETTDQVSISEEEWLALTRVSRSDARAFYVELRRSLVHEYQYAVSFTLPANELAAAEFLPGKRDRKLYLKLTQDLLRIGLVARVKPAGFTCDGRRCPALFMFRAPVAGNVIFLSDRARNRR